MREKPTNTPQPASIFLAKRKISHASQKSKPNTEFITLVRKTQKFEFWVQ
jgi:hypothetical protein